MYCNVMKFTPLMKSSKFNFFLERIPPKLVSAKNKNMKNKSRLRIHNYINLNHVSMAMSVIVTSDEETRQGGTKSS